MDIFWNRHTKGFLLKLLQCFPVKRNRILCFSWGGQQYSDNPKAITNELLKNKVQNDWEIIYAFYNPQDFITQLPDGIGSVSIGSFRYFYLLATSHIVISNTRIDRFLWPFKKRNDQLYIQTMHGGHGLKRIELDVKESLSNDYVDSIYAESQRTDLMISDSTFFTRLIRSAFAYPDGEVLEVGLPRNDIFFIPETEKLDLRKKVLAKLGFHENKCNTINTIIYCPTFRNNHRRDVYGFNVDKVLSAFERRFGGEWYVLVSSHPNMKSYYQQLYDFNHPRLVDVGNYPDLQELLVISDVAITDYSSAGFEFTLSNKPVFILARDCSDYDRGFYFRMPELPFPFADNDDQLCENILNFNYDVYRAKLQKFNEQVVGLKETGRASKIVAEWIISHSK